MHYLLAAQNSSGKISVVSTLCYFPPQKFWIYPRKKRITLLVTLTLSSVHMFSLSAPKAHGLSLHHCFILDVIITFFNYDIKNLIKLDMCSFKLDMWTG